MTDTSRQCPKCGAILEVRRFGPHLSGHTRQERAKYLYDDEKDPRHKHPLVCRKCDYCGISYVGRKGSQFCSYQCSKAGHRNPTWKGDDADYVSLHARVYRARGKAFGCSVCGTTEASLRYEWANLTSNYADTEDFASMCKHCHAQYDMARRPDGGRSVFTDDLLDAAEHMTTTMTIKAVAQKLEVSYPNLTQYLKKRREARLPT